MKGTFTRVVMVIVLTYDLLLFRFFEMLAFNNSPWVGVPQLSNLLAKPTTKEEINEIKFMLV
jgi:hypothetical protein